MFGLQQTGATTSEPISSGELKSHLRLNTSDEDTLLAPWITAARVAIENLTLLSLITQTWQLTLDYWPWSMAVQSAAGRQGSMVLLPRPPLRSVTTLKYRDTAGVEHTLSSSAYIVDTASARLLIAEPPALSSKVLPAVTVTYVTGYTAVPAPLVQAIKLLAADFYSKREASSEMRFEELPFGARVLLSGYRHMRQSPYGLE